jgi:NADH-quinone oxidoreductase subunit L
MDSYGISSLVLVMLPLLSFMILAVAGKHFSPKVSALVGTSSILISALLAFYVAGGYFFEFGNISGAFSKQIILQFNWLQFTNDLSINLGIVLDPLSVMMLVVITTISAMVHIYSINYMNGEEYFERYYSYLSLFTFSMLGLVVSVNIFQMYIFWELVGASSFLLIGFYFTKPSAIAAAKKAFIVTRFADLGFLIGILMLSAGAKSLDFFTIIERLTTPGSAYLANFSGSFIGMSALSWTLLLVFIGGAGKSAMFPFHIWLPDAMEGPTPVSALIHAATMVVAGVFLVGRLFPVFAISAPDALLIIGYTGAFTALFAAIIACTQTDIKRVLAYSTISQIAYMMFALGVARWGADRSEGFTASMFHLFTHAFFKALLFLGAGAIIHAVGSNELKNMGGLRKSLPITHITFLIACLAISSIPPFAGFFSKEAILSSAMHSNPMIYYVGLFTGGLTAFYMFRLYFRIFWFKKPELHAHNHEKHTWFMNVPLILLAIGSVVAGLIPFGHFVSANGEPIELTIHLGSVVLPVLVALTGIATAYLYFARESFRPEQSVAKFMLFYNWAINKFYIDEVYLFITKKVLFNLIGRPIAWVDKEIINGAINGTARLSMKTSEMIKPVQSGRTQTYAMFFMGGALVLAAILIFKFV